MSIVNEIARLQNAKSALATSIGNKGVTVPSSTTLDGYSALVDQIQTGGGGGEGWQRPSEWPDYSKIPLSGVGANEVYLTYDCRGTITGGTPDAIVIRATASGGYTVERGSIENNGFVAVTTNSVASNTDFYEQLPTDEGDFVVYRVTASNNITAFSFRGRSNYIGTAQYYASYQPCLEMYGKLEYITSIGTVCTNIISFIVSLKQMTTMEKMFENDYVLENVDATIWDTSHVTIFSRLFYSCYLLKYIDVSEIDVSSATTMQQMFYNCKSLEEFDVGEWDTGNCTSFYQTFTACGVESIDVSEWDTSKLTTAHGMFASCPKLRTVDISEWDTSKVTSVHELFANCTLFAGADFSQLDFSLLTDNFQIVGNCPHVSTVHFNNTLSVVSAQAFANTPMCTTFIFESTTPPTLSHTNAFGGNSTRKIYVPDESVEDYKTASNWSTYASYIYPISDLT